VFAKIFSFKGWIGWSDEVFGTAPVSPFASSICDYYREVRERDRSENQNPADYSGRENATHKANGTQTHAEKITSLSALLLVSSSRSGTGNGEYFWLRTHGNLL